MRNAAIDQLRARGARPTVTLDAANGLAADGVAPTEYAETREESAVLAEALAGMRRNYREALLMRFGIGLTIPEIAERRGITLNAAKKLVLRGTRQAGQRLLDVTSEAHCEEMQTLAKRQLVEKYLAEVGTEQEMAELEKHLEHCGRCKSLVLTLHDGLHEAASGAIVSGSVAGELTGKVGAIDHLAGWAHGAHDHAQLIGEKVRLATFKATDALGGGDPAAGGAFAGAGAKIATACGGAAAAACLATGVVGPGVPSVAIGSGHEKPPAQEQTTTTVPPVASTTTQTTAEQPTQTETTSVASAPAENPVQQVKKQLYGSGSTTFRHLGGQPRLRGTGEQQFEHGRKWGRRQRRKPGELRTMTTKEETMYAIANRRRLRGLTLRFVALIALAVAALAGGASSARADYRVVQCDYTRTSYSEAGAVALGAYSVWATNSCGNDYGLILRTGTDTGWTANGAGLAWQFTAPAGTTFDATALVHYGYDSGFGTAVQSDTGGFAGLPTCPTGPGSCWANPATVNAHYFQVRLMCFKSPNCHSDWAYTYTRNFEATVHDGSLPYASATGQLLNGDVASGVEGLNVNASDAGGGVGAVNIYVNGIYSRNVPICTPDVGGYAYQALKPCPDSASRGVADRHGARSGLDERAERARGLCGGCWRCGFAERLLTVL